MYFVSTFTSFYRQGILDLRYLYLKIAIKEELSTHFDLAYNALNAKFVANT